MAGEAFAELIDQDVSSNVHCPKIFKGKLLYPSNLNLSINLCRFWTSSSPRLSSRLPQRCSISGVDKFWRPGLESSPSFYQCWPSKTMEPKCPFSSTKV